MTFTPLIDQLIESLRCLPGVGAKSAQRMAFYLLERERESGLKLAESLQQAMIKVGHCQSCWTLSEETLCKICSSTHRDKHLLCVVESPADVSAIEQTAHYRGLYFVLMGHLSPIEGIKPEDIGVPKLLERIKQGEVKELIFALSPTAEGEATSHYIAGTVAGMDLLLTKLAQGVPFGEVLEFVDGGTLAYALTSRRPV